MNKIKQHWKEISIIVLALGFLSKCTQSCNRATQIDMLTEELEAKSSSSDSIITILEDSCRSMSTTIKIYEERVSGMEQSLSIQEEAARRISEAKKNISVNVRTNK